MARLNPAPKEQYEPVFGEGATLGQRIYSQRPDLAAAMAQLGATLLATPELPRLVELVRLRIAFHNQCRSCMAIRYGSSTEDRVTEDLVCSLERPQEAEDLTDAERAALAYADLMATNHLAIDDSTFDRLREHFTEPEIVELCMLVALCVGFGRMEMSWDMVDELPDRFRRRDGQPITPWGGDGELMHVALTA